MDTKLTCPVCNGLVLIRWDFSRNPAGVPVCCGCPHCHFTASFKKEQ